MAKTGAWWLSSSNGSPTQDPNVLAGISDLPANWQDADIITLNDFLSSTAAPLAGKGSLNVVHQRHPEFSPWHPAQIACIYCGHPFIWGLDLSRHQRKHEQPNIPNAQSAQSQARSTPIPSCPPSLTVSSSGASLGEASVIAHLVRPKFVSSASNSSKAEQSSRTRGDTRPKDHTNKHKKSQSTTPAVDSTKSLDHADKSRRSHRVLQSRESERSPSLSLAATTLQLPAVASDGKETKSDDSRRRSELRTHRLLNVVRILIAWTEDLVARTDETASTSCESVLDHEQPKDACSSTQGSGPLNEGAGDQSNSSSGIFRTSISGRNFYSSSTVQRPQGASTEDVDGALPQVATSSVTRRTVKKVIPCICKSCRGKALCISQLRRSLETLEHEFWYCDCYDLGFGSEHEFKIHREERNDKHHCYESEEWRDLLDEDQYALLAKAFLKIYPHEEVNEKLQREDAEPGTVGSRSHGQGGARRRKRKRRDELDEVLGRYREIEAKLSAIERERVEEQAEREAERAGFMKVTANQNEEIIRLKGANQALTDALKLSMESSMRLNTSQNAHASSFRERQLLPEHRENAVRPQSSNRRSSTLLQQEGGNHPITPMIDLATLTPHREVPQQRQQQRRETFAHEQVSLRQNTQDMLQSPHVGMFSPTMDYTDLSVSTYGQRTTEAGLPEYVNPQHIQRETSSGNDQATWPVRGTTPTFFPDGAAGVDRSPGSAMVEDEMSFSPVDHQSPAPGLAGPYNKNDYEQGLGELGLPNTGSGKGVDRRR